MATVVIQLAFASGSPTAVSLLTLTDGSGNTPSGITFPAAFTDNSGTWTFSFSGTAVTYDFTFNVTDNTGTYGPFNGQVNTGTNYVGRYISQNSLDLFLGTINLSIQTDTDSTGISNPAAIQQVIQAAEDEIDSRLSAAPPPYLIPLQFASGYINQALALVAHKLAAINAFEKRILITSTKTWPSFRQMRVDAEKWLTDAWYGDIVIVGATPASTASLPAPVARGANRNAIGVPIFPNGSPAWPWGVGGYGFPWVGGWYW